MPTKSEIVKKIEGAAARVLKQSNYGEGVVSALTVVIAKLTEVRDKLAAAGDVDPNLHQALFDELYECGRIVGSIYDGFPMVPAVALSDAGESGTAKMASADVAKECTELLAKAASEQGMAAGAGVARALCLVGLWKAAGEEDPEGAELVVPKPEAMIELAKLSADKRRAEKLAKEAAAAPAPTSEPASEPEPEDPVAKLDAIAKAATPAPAPPAPAPAPTTWPVDLNRRR